VKAHQDDKKPYNDLDIWGQMNCDADGLAEKFRKLMDDGDVKPLKEGFFTDSMEVGISVDGGKGDISPSPPDPIEDTGQQAPKVFTG
jgi:hypothetical protein